MKVKNILFSICFSVFLSALFIFAYSNSINAMNVEYCTINNIEYQLPKDLALASYQISGNEYLNGIVEILTEDEINEFITISSINDCNSFDYVFSSSSSIENEEYKYEIKNMLLDTPNDGTWSSSHYSSYINNESIELKGIGQIKTFFDLDLINNTSYKFFINNYELQNIDSVALPIDENPIFEVYLIDADGINVSNKVIIEGGTYTFDDEKNCYLFNYYQNSSRPTLIVDEKNIPITTFDIISFYDDPKYLNDIISTIKVNDNIDGNTPTISIEEDNYTNYEKIIGKHFVWLSTTDSSNNIAYCHLNIYVVDKIAPIIEGKDTINMYLSKKTTLEDLIKTNFNLYDDYDGDVSNSLEITNSNIDLSIPNTYSVSFKVNDASNNISYQTINIKVIDDIPPIFTLNEEYYLYTSAKDYIGIDDMIYVFKRDNLISEDFLSYEICEDNYSSSYNQEGTYKVTLRFTYPDRMETASINVVVEDEKIVNKSNQIWRYVIFGLTIFIFLFILRKINKAILN